MTTVPSDLASLDAKLAMWCSVGVSRGVLVQVKPALLHGDLWSGNMTTVSDGSWAILDPAVYYGALLLVCEQGLLGCCTA